MGRIRESSESAPPLPTFCRVPCKYPLDLLGALQCWNSEHSEALKAAQSFPRSRCEVNCHSPGRRRASVRSGRRVRLSAGNAGPYRSAPRRRPRLRDLEGMLSELVLRGWPTTQPVGQVERTRCLLPPVLPVRRLIALLSRCPFRGSRLALLPPLRDPVTLSEALHQAGHPRRLSWKARKCKAQAIH